jgi:hypothetical protein
MRHTALDDWKMFVMRDPSPYDVKYKALLEGFKIVCGFEQKVKDIDCDTTGQR